MLTQEQKNYLVGKRDPFIGKIISAVYVVGDENSYILDVDYEDGSTVRTTNSELLDMIELIKESDVPQDEVVEEVKPEPKYKEGDIVELQDAVNIWDNTGPKPRVTKIVELGPVESITVNGVVYHVVDGEEISESFIVGLYKPEPKYKEGDFVEVKDGSVKKITIIESSADGSVFYYYTEGSEDEFIVEEEITGLYKPTNKFKIGKKVELEKGEIVSIQDFNTEEYPNQYIVYNSQTGERYPIEESYIKGYYSDKVTKSEMADYVEKMKQETQETIKNAMDEFTSRVSKFADNPNERPYIDLSTEEVKDVLEKYRSVMRLETDKFHKERLRQVINEYEKELRNR